MTGFIDSHSWVLGPGTLSGQAIGNHCTFGKSQWVVYEWRGIFLPDSLILLAFAGQIQSSNPAG